MIPACAMTFVRPSMILALPRRVPGILAALMVLSGLAAAQTPPATAAFGRIRGTIFDSLHRVPMASANVIVGMVRVGLTDAYGEYSIDSIPPGSYQVYVAHAVLDTIGITLATAPLPIRAGEVVTLDIGLPSAERLVALRCPAAILAARGPGAIFGQVSDPDSLKPAVGAKVQLLYEDGGILGLKPRSTVREAVVDSSGGYRICGLPTPLIGKLQVSWNGVSSGQVEVRVDSAPLALRSLSIAVAQTVSTVADSAGRTTRVATGSARLSGKIMNREGRPVEAARVSIEGSRAVSLTNARGEFSLENLPPGTQSIEVRKIGYGPTDRSVELSGSSSAAVTVVMNPYELPAMKVEATRDKALADLGYVDRKRQGLGHYIDGDKLRTTAPRFSDVVRGAPMLKMTPTSRGRYVIQNARDPNGGCVSFFVDGQRWEEMAAGDIDDFIQPSELAAIEVYNPSSAPGRFQSPGSTSCTTIVIWTVRATNKPKKK